MTAKEWLGSYLQLQDEIDANRDMIAYISAKATSCTGSYERAAAAHGITRKAESSVVQIDARQRAIERLLEEQTAIYQAIDSVENPQYRTALVYIYLRGYTQEKTGELMHYERHRVRFFRDRGLEAIKIPEKYKYAQSGCSSSER